MVFEAVIAKQTDRLSGRLTEFFTVICGIEFSQKIHRLQLIFLLLIKWITIDIIRNEYEL